MTSAALKKDDMASFIPMPDPITPAWLTAVLGASGLLAAGEVVSVTSTETGAFNSHTGRLQLEFSQAAPPGLAANMILKRNTQEPWAIEAGAEEVKFYQLAA